MAEKIIAYDLDGYDIVTNALMELLDQYPKLDGKIAFSVLPTGSGKAMIPTGGSVIQSETRDITGHVIQECMYPFNLYYKASGLSEAKKIKVKEWLDDLGRWLERQPIKVGNKTYTLNEYPPLTEGRYFKSIKRVTPGYWDSTNDDGSEVWTILINAVYINEFDL